MSGPTYTRRQAYAQFLLFGDPIAMREHLTKVAMLVVTVADVAELGRWKRAFLGDNLIGEHVFDDADPDSLLAYAEGTWAGRLLQFQVFAPKRQDDDVDELAAGGTREQLQQLVDEPRCPTCGEPERLLASGAVGHCGDEHGNDCCPALRDGAS